MVTFLVWLCLTVIKPPFLKYKTYCMSYLVPQIHGVGRRDNGQPYLSFTKFQTSCLFKQYSSSFSGNVDNHIDEPFSWCMLFNFSYSSDKEYRDALNFCVFFRPRYLCSSLVILILAPENILFVLCDTYGLTTSHVFVCSGSNRISDL